MKFHTIITIMFCAVASAAAQDLSVSVPRGIDILWDKPVNVMMEERARAKVTKGNVLKDLETVNVDSSQVSEPFVVELEPVKPVIVKAVEPKKNDLDLIYTGASFEVYASRNALDGKEDFLRLVRPFAWQTVNMQSLEQIVSSLNSQLQSLGFTTVSVRVHQGVIKPFALFFEKTELSQPLQVNADQMLAQLQANYKSKENVDENLLSKKGAQLGRLAMGAVEAEDKELYALNMAQSYAEGAVNSYASEFLSENFSWINSNLGVRLYDEGRLKLSGKILYPFYNTASLTIFSQSGITQSFSDREIAHLGFGFRSYPEAVSLEQSGNWMWGLNSFIDYDLDRQHRRMSLGAELMYDTFRLSLNGYKHISGWRTSPDYDNGLILERAADGFDINLQYALGIYTPLSFELGYAQWFGSHVDVFGDPDNLESDPHVVSYGITWSPVQAISFSLYRENSPKNHNTAFEMQFNIPLDAEIMNAFEPQFAGLENTLAGSRNAFVVRDYTMPLERKAVEDRYMIDLLSSENNAYIFGIYDGWGDAVYGLNTTVKFRDQCVISDVPAEGYITDGDGRFVVNILSVRDCEQPYTSAHASVTAGLSTSEFDLPISNVTFNINAPSLITQKNTAEIVITSQPNVALTLSHNYELADLDPETGSIDVGSIVSGSQSSNSTLPYKLLLKSSMSEVGNDVLYTDQSGRLELVLQPISESEEYYVTITASSVLTGSEKSAKVGVALEYELDFGELEGDNALLVWEDQDQDGNFDVSFTLSGGRPQQQVELSIEHENDLNVSALGGGELVFDASGRVTVFIEQKDSVTLTDNVGGEVSVDLERHSFVIVPPEFNPVLTVPERITYGENFEVSVSNAKPNSEVAFLDSLDAKPSNASVTADRLGNAHTAYTGYTNYIAGGRAQLSIEAAASAAGAEIKTFSKTIQVVPSAFDWSQIDDTLVLEDSDGDLLGDIRLELVGGVPGQPFLMNGRDQSLIMMTDEAGNASPVFDENGRLTLVLEENAAGTDNYVIVFAIDGQGSKEVVLTHANVVPVLTVPQSVHYLEGFTVEIDNAGPLAEIEFLPIDNDPESLSQSGIVHADRYGHAEITYEGISNFEIKSSFTVKVTYSTADGKNEVSKEITLVEPSLQLQKVSINEISDLIQRPAARLSGGFTGEEIEWIIDGDGRRFDNGTQDSFDSRGEALIYVQPQTPYVEPITISAKTLARDVGPVEFAYNFASTEIAVDYSDASVNFKGQPKTIDLETDYTLTFSNLTPGTKLTLNTVGEVRPKQSEFTVGSDGRVVAQFNAVTEPSTETIQVTGTYQASSAGNSVTEFTCDPLVVFKYSEENGAELVVSGSSVLNDYNQVTLNLNGARPNSRFTVSIEGSASSDVISGITDQSGHAVLHLSAASPFNEDDPIIVTVSCAGAEIDNNEITLELLNRASAHNFTVEGEASNYSGLEIDYGERYTITIDQVVPNSKVIWQGSGVAKPLSDSSIADQNCVGSGIFETCSAQMTFEPVTDYTVRTLNGANAITGFSAGDLSELDDPQTPFTVPTITLHYYSVQAQIIEGDNSLDYALDSGARETATIRFTGGMPNAVVDFELVDLGGGQVSAEFVEEPPSTFNSSGYADVKVQLAEPYTGSFRVRLTTQGQTYDSPILYVMLTPYEPMITISQSGAAVGGGDIIDYRLPFVVTISSTRDGGLIDGSVVTWVSDPSNNVVPTSNNSTVSNGSASMSFAGIDDFDVEQITVRGTYPYTISDLDHEFEQTIYLYTYTPTLNATSIGADAGETFDFVLENARVGEAVVWNKTEGLTDSVTDGYESTIGSDGEATYTVSINSLTTGTDQNVTVNAEVMGDSLSYSVPIQLREYYPDMVLPTYEEQEATVDYRTPFEITVLGLRTMTELELTLRGNDGSVIASRSGMVMDTGDGFGYGSVTFNFDGITNWAIETITVEIEYNFTANERVSNSDRTIAMVEYNPVVELTGGQNMDTGDSAEFTITNGRPGEIVTLSTSDPVFELSASQVELDKYGAASVTITAGVPSSPDIQSLNGTVTASFMGRDEIRDLSLDLREYTASSVLSAPYSGIYAGDTSFVPDVNTTIDYFTDYEVVVTGLRPGSTVTPVANGNAMPKSISPLTANDQGSVTIVYEAIEDYSVKSVTAQYKYVKRSNLIETASFAINLVNYHLTLTPDKDTIIRDEVVAVTLSGGRPGESISWSLTGNGVFNENSGTTLTSEFDGSGNSVVHVRGVTPYSDTINIASSSKLSSIMYTTNISLVYINDDNFDFTSSGLNEGVGGYVVHLKGNPYETMDISVVFNSQAYHIDIGPSSNYVQFANHQSSGFSTSFNIQMDSSGNYDLYFSLCSSHPQQTCLDITITINGESYDLLDYS